MKLKPILTAVAALIPAAALVALGVTAALRNVPARELPVLHQVPSFSFKERSGRTVKLEDLQGKVWVADFIFTNCAGICPGMTANLRKVEDALRDVGGEVLLVSFTVDPERDTGERLTTYAKSQGAGENWLFLRGPRDEVARLSREGFLLGSFPTEDAFPPQPAVEPGTEPIAHDRHFVLVDRLGRIRGYYDGIEAAAVPDVARDARALLKETPPAP
jgi:cytochrome oxidase Cu insertion factor (SCO1/SenC/PrrC family)